ncbi:hypothetical protein BJ170DRAFT_303706 [Xylariales sp. AK1849]|nr:hypothetical protein BJ170DRAFT_303706 [Xylariales sp. AK1849]
MQLISLITAAGLAASTNAFLLPLPEPSGDDLISTLPVPIEADITTPRIAESQTLKLACPGCPVRVGHHWDDDEAPKIKTDIPSHLELDFSIDHDIDHDRLMLNGVELYPEPDLLRDTLGARLLRDDKERRHKKLPGHRKGKGKGKGKHHQPLMQPLGFGMSSSLVAQSKEDNMELLQVNLQVIEVGNVFVDGIPSVEIKLIKTPEGALMIGGIETIASGTWLKTPMDKLEECTTLLCKWRAIVMQQLGRLKASKHCGGRRPGHAAAQIDGVHGHPGHHQAMNHRHRSWSQLLKNIASHILLPIAVGIAAGITASILGMMVGTAIVYLWRTFVRPAGAGRHHHHRRGHSTHKAVQNEVGAGEEKAGLMSHQEEEVEAPPAYVEEGLVENDEQTEK